MIKYLGGGVIVLLLIFSSCTTQKQLTYLQDIDTIQSPVFPRQDNPPYRIRKGDILYVKISSLDPRVNEIYNPNFTQNQVNLFNNDQSLYIYGYSVNDTGYVDIHLIGTIRVEGLTIEEASQAIKAQTNKVLRDASAIVKLLSFKYSVLGEVSRPGTYTNFNDQLTVLEAISRAGDINEFGNRKKVLVLRPSKDNKTITYQLDLTNSRFITSDAFYLLPNDIVYVKPLKSRPFKANLPILGLILSSVSTLILVLSFIQK
jgi:polysaccharide export outer membrane protein